MAVLSKIRQRSLLLILVIGFCLLAFIIGDIINSGGFGVTRNVGSVNGEDIPVQEYLQKVNQLQSNQPGISPTQAENAVWNQEVERILFEERFEKAGIRVGKEHVLNMYSANPQVNQNPQFMNALGQFDRAKFNEFLVNMKRDNPAQWEFFEQNRPLVEASAKKQLYITMLRAGFVATKNDGMASYKAETDKVDFDYVYVPFSTVNDDEVKVSDEEIVAYMKKNEKKYKSEPTRSLIYVKIEDKASTADELKIRTEIEALLNPKDSTAGFRNVTNVEEYVNANSEIKYDSTYVTKKELPLDHAEAIFNLNKGEVYGPYKDNGYYKLTKMVNKKPNASAKASHILIAYKDAMRAAPNVTRTKEEAKAKAEELLRDVNANPSSFAQLAMANTDDPGSKNTGGMYDNIAPGQMVPAFDSFVFNNPVGKTGVVETDFGYHVIKVDAKYEAVQLATIALALQPSKSTSDEIYAKASQFELDAAAKPFEDIAKSANLTAVPVSKILPADENVQGLGSQRSIVVWAFNDDTKEGDVRKFDVPDGHVIVKVTNVNETGLMSIEEAKLAIAPILRNEKKAEIVKEKMKGDNLEAVAKASGSRVMNAEDVTLASAMIPTVGNEPKVVGTAFALESGKTSGLITGKQGVFMIKSKGVEKAPEMENYSVYSNRVKNQAKSAVASRITTALKDAADIEDNRF